MKSARPRVVLVTRQTRMQGLLSRFATRSQAKFKFRGAKVASFAQAGMLDQAAMVQKLDTDEDFDALEEEHETYEGSVSLLQRELNLGVPVQTVDRELVHTIDFAQCACIVVAGPDGLVANTAKYAAGVPIVGVNPDPSRIDGVLLPYTVDEARNAVARVLNHRAVVRSVVLAEAVLDDGQRMLAFNDLFIGARTHTSARYELSIRAGVETRRVSEEKPAATRRGIKSVPSESQSSSGVLVSTGAGSTGWMSSVYNMACGVATWVDNTLEVAPPPALSWEADELLWAVREPFRTQTTGVTLCAGRLGKHDQLRIESQMSREGVIFSDGVESDFLPFNGGSIAHIGIAKERAQLVAKTPSI